LKLKFFFFSLSSPVLALVSGVMPIQNVLICWIPFFEAFSRGISLLWDLFFSFCLLCRSSFFPTLRLKGPPVPSAYLSHEFLLILPAAGFSCPTGGSPPSRFAFFPSAPFFPSCDRFSYLGRRNGGLSPPVFDFLFSPPFFLAGHVFVFDSFFSIPPCVFVSSYWDLPVRIDTVPDKRGSQFPSSPKVPLVCFLPFPASDFFLNFLLLHRKRKTTAGLPSMCVPSLGLQSPI